VSHSPCVFCDYSEKWAKIDWDLHVLFEAGGNQPEERLLVLDALDELVQAGMLDARSGDFYALTEKGKRAAAQP